MLRRIVTDIRHRINSWMNMKVSPIIKTLCLAWNLSDSTAACYEWAYRLSVSYGGSIGTVGIV